MLMGRELGLKLDLIHQHRASVTKKLWMAERLIQIMKAQQPKAAGPRMFCLMKKLREALEAIAEGFLDQDGSYSFARKALEGK